MASPELIRLESVHKAYAVGNLRIVGLRGVSLSVRRGEFVAVMGSSGSGKSTFMNILGCLDRPTSGRYYFDGVDTATLNVDELADLRNSKLGFVFQGFNLLPRTTAVENVELPMLCGARQRRSNRSARSRAVDHLTKLGLADRIDHFPNQLSGGQQQRVAIARALVNEPQVILADEPTGNLDSKTAIEIMEIFRQLNDSGMSIIMVTHEKSVSAYCKRCLTIRDGEVVDDRSIAGKPSTANALSETLTSPGMDGDARGARC